MGRCLTSLPPAQRGPNYKVVLELRYLEQAQEEEELPGFYNYADQYTIRALTAIGQQLGIESRIHNHVGRGTFATEFIRRGGQVEVLQKLMGHTKITTTMK